jgi:peptide/nickel transport system permease protein
MLQFIIRRFFTSLIALIGATLIIFSVSRLLGDPRVLLLPDDAYGITEEVWEELSRQLNLDKPIPFQYALWLWDLARGDLGRDLADRQLIAPKIPTKIGPTLRLAVSAWVLATLVGIPIGVLSAIKRGSVGDYVGRTFALLGQTLPLFWIAILSILIFSVWLNWLPSGTMGEGFQIQYYILPTVTLAWFAAAGYVRLVRSAMLEVLDSEFIKLARAKGVGSNSVIWKHAFKNASIAPLTYSGVLFAGFITGSISIEVVFAWPGIARYAVEAVWTNNFTVLAVVTLMFTATFIAINFLVDILYAFIDPRIRYS